MLQGPEPGAHCGGSGLEQGGNEEGETAGAGAEGFEKGAEFRRGIVSGGDDAEALGDAVQRAAGTAVRVRFVDGMEEGFEVLADLFVQVALEAGAEALALGAVDEFAADDLDAGAKDGGAGADARDFLTVPDDGVVVGEGEGIGRRGFGGGDAAGHFLPQGAAGGAHDQLAFLAHGAGIGERR